MKTWNFKEEEYDYKCPDKCVGQFTDYRNGIVCINPTCDLECYLNYIELLNANRDKWKNVGYLDLGMVPILMAPSFMQSHLLNVVTDIANSYKLPIYWLPPVSLMQDGCRLQTQDIWAFREDIARVAGYSSDEEVSTAKLIRHFMKKLESNK